jgi:hypothetical protein
VEASKEFISDEDAVVSDLQSQIWANSMVARKKHEMCRKAVIALEASLLFAAMGAISAFWIQLLTK